MPRVFISYRREDSQDATGRIYDRLIQALPREDVFRDVDNIPVGVDFRKALEDAVSRCEVALVIIGPRWLSVADPKGRRRLESANDFVRIEVETALTRNLRVVPVIVSNAAMPSPEDLPEALRELAFRNGRSVRPDPDFHHDMDRLIREIVTERPERRTAPAPPRALAVPPAPAPALPKPEPVPAAPAPAPTPVVERPPDTAEVPARAAPPSQKPAPSAPARPQEPKAPPPPGQPSAREPSPRRRESWLAYSAVAVVLLTVGTLLSTRRRPENPVAEPVAAPQPPVAPVPAPKEPEPVPPPVVEPPATQALPETAPAPAPALSPARKRVQTRQEPAPPKRAVSPSEAGIEWVTIHGGKFKIYYDVVNRRDGYRASAPSFQIAKTEVTNRQYRLCVQAGACTEPKDHGASFNGDDQPVVGVDWEQASAFSKWVGGRLPSQQEWIYAARSEGKNWIYPWGNQDPTCDLAVITPLLKAAYTKELGCGKPSTLPVCSKPAGNTKQGLCDMAGNANEWVQDWYHFFFDEETRRRVGCPTDGSACEKTPEGRERKRLTHGGSWASPELCRADDEIPYEPETQSSYLSFRPARPLQP